MIDLGVYLSLFLSAAAAATVLPLQSEAVVTAALLHGYPPLAVLAAASVGNVLGAVVNWFLGRGIERFSGRPWFPVGPAALARAQDWYRRYGRWSLLLSWLPIVGDPLTLVAGVMREKLWLFVLLVAIAKVGRYAALAAAVLSWG
ncbi:MAG: YqaA family protein [Reyranellaceae bacterium]